MASVRKIGGRKPFICEVRLKGHRPKSKTFLTRREANIWGIEQEQALGLHGGMVTGRTLRDAFALYSEEVSPTKKGGRWEKARLKALQKDTIAECVLVNLTVQEMQAWVDRRQDEVSPATVNRELNLISSVLKRCRTKWKWMQHNPMTDIDRPKNPPHRDRLISADEIKRMLKALEYEELKPVVTARQQIAVGFLLALETAMRRGEIWGLTWQHVHLKQAYVVLPDTKNGSKREVGLSKRAVALLKKMQAVDECRVFSVPAAVAEVMFRRARQLAQIEDMTFHDTRHTAITRLAKKLSMLELARMAGHRDPRSLMIYYNETASEIAKKLG